MKITNQLSDDAILKELGNRFAQARLERNLTQAGLAGQAGVSKRTVERLESGEVAVQLSGLLRISRVLGLVERLEVFLPKAVASPMEQLKRQGRKRHRARPKKSTAVEEAPAPWAWGEES